MMLQNFGVLSQTLSHSQERTQVMKNDGRLEQTVFALFAGAVALMIVRAIFHLMMKGW